MIQNQPHNNFFVEFFGKEKYSMELLKFILPKDYFDALDWATVRFEINTFISREGRERRSDLIFWEFQFQGPGRKTSTLMAKGSLSHRQLDNSYSHQKKNPWSLLKMSLRRKHS